MHFPSPTLFRILAQEFEALHGIPHITEQLMDLTFQFLYMYYYCQTSFYLVLLQGIAEQNVYFRITNLDWHEVCTIGYYLNYTKYEEIA